VRPRWPEQATARRVRADRGAAWKHPAEAAVADGGRESPARCRL